MRRLAALFALVLTTSACGGSDSGSGSADPEPTDDTADLAPYVQGHARPVGLTATDDGSICVVGSGSTTLSRIPAGAEAPDLTVDVDGVPLRATSAYGAVWVTSFHGKRLVRIDPGTGDVTGTVRTGAGPEGVGAGF